MLDASDNHAAAAEAFIKARGWDERKGQWIMGAKADNAGYVFAWYKGGEG